MGLVRGLASELLDQPLPVVAAAGFFERFHRMVTEQYLTVASRRTFYESLDQLQADLDRDLEFYNRDNTHRGYRTKESTPWQALSDALAL